MTAASRERLLGNVKRALKGRAPLEHPGPLATPGSISPVDAFRDRFSQNGGEVAGPVDSPTAWLASFLDDLPSGERPDQGRPTVAPGTQVPTEWVAGLQHAPPEVANVGISMASGAAADSGSVLLASTSARKVQLLPPIHVVFVAEHRIHPTLGEALEEAHSKLPAALGVHSGPSKSADIGSTLVKGVHGPGRIIAVLVPPRVWDE